MPSARRPTVKAAAADNYPPLLADPLNPLAAEVGKAVAQEVSKYKIRSVKARPGKARAVPSEAASSKAELGERITILVADVLERSLSSRTAKGKALRMALIAKLASSEIGGAQTLPGKAAAAPTDVLLTTAEVAARLEVSRPHVSMLCDAGKLGEIVLTEGGHRRIRESAVDSYLATRTGRLEGAKTPREAGVEAGLYDHEDGYFRNVVREKEGAETAPATRKPAKPRARKVARKFWS